MEKSDLCSTEYPDQMLLDKKDEEMGRGKDLYGGGAENEGLGGWKGASDREGSLTKTGLVGAIER